MSKRGEIYTLDAILSTTVILLTATKLVSLRQLSIATTPSLPEEELSAMLNDMDFINSIYANDIARLRLLVNSYVSRPYNLTIYAINGTKLLSIGEPLDGLATTAVIAGWNGTLEVRIVSLKVRR